MFRKITGFRDMAVSKGLFMAIKGKFEDVMDAFRQVKRCNDLVLRRQSMKLARTT